MVKAVLKKILVTGANGFVGKALCEALEHEGINFTAAVRIAKTAEEVAVGNIDENTVWDKALSGCDTVVHLAARVHVMHDTATDPLASYRSINTAGTLRLAQQAAEAGVTHFVFVSTIKVLGESGYFTRDDQPQPLDPYAVSKLEAEQALLALGTQTGMKITIIRPPLVYGPGVGANFRKLLGAVKRGIPLPFGLVNNQRSLVYVGNLVSLIATSVKNEKSHNEVLLVDDGKPISTRNLILAMAKALNRKTFLIPVPCLLITALATLLGKKAAAQRLLGNLAVDSSHTRQLLNWHPPYSLDSGLRATVKNHTSNKQTA